MQKQTPNNRMEDDWGGNRPQKGFLAQKMISSPEVGSG